jgi:hypothetical protein
MYPEVKTLRRSQHALKQLQGILPVLKSHVLPIENHITRHYQQHRFELVEPEISVEYSMEEAMTMFKAAAHTLDQHTGLSFHGPPLVAQIMMDLPTREIPPDAIDPLDDFADYCVNNLDLDSLEPMVSYIKKFQNRRGETGPAEPCKHAACSRTHPTNECCICRGPHFVNRCWHVIGLPDGIKAIKDNFVNYILQKMVHGDKGMTAVNQQGTRVSPQSNLKTYRNSDHIPTLPNTLSRPFNPRLIRPRR